MQQDIENLMKPRYKVIAIYPYCPYEVGDMVEISDAGTSFHCTTTKEWNEYKSEFSDTVNYFSIGSIKNFPHLFRKLSWWEERTVEEMPEYVKRKNDPNIVGKIGNLHPEHKEIFWIEGNRLNDFETFTFWIPATESDYFNTQPK